MAVAPPLLDWKLRFREPELDRLYAQHNREQQLLLDVMVMLLNLLVLLNIGSSRLQMDHRQALVHSISLALLAGHGSVMLLGRQRYLEHRPLLMVLQRLWRTALRLQSLQSILQAAAGSLAATAAAGSGPGRQALQLLLRQLAAVVPSDPSFPGGAAGPAAAATACSAAAARGGWVGSSSGSSSAAPFQAAGPGSAPQLLLDVLLLSSDVVPSWVYLWAFPAPWSALPLLQLLCLLLAAAADVPRLLCRLSAPALQPAVASIYNVLSAAANLLLLPLVPEASVSQVWCPSVPALPLVLWVQLFLLLVAPLYVSYHCERSAKIWWWLRRLAAQPGVPADLADEAQLLLREVRPAGRVLLSHTVLLLVVAALCWQVCELAYWLAIPQPWLQQLGRLMAARLPPAP